MSPWPAWLMGALGASVPALIGGVLVANFIGAEKKIERLYALDDPRFMTEQGVLLGPPFVDGNRIRALLNGDRIFPPMLAAIRSATLSINFETCKVLIVDRLLLSVGSTNFDNRSFRLNDEATLNVVDPDFAAAQTAAFESDLELSHRVSHAEWLHRPRSDGTAMGNDASKSCSFVSWLRLSRHSHRS